MALVASDTLIDKIYFNEKHTCGCFLSFLFSFSLNTFWLLWPLFTVEREESGAERGNAEDTVQRWMEPLFS